MGHDLRGGAKCHNKYLVPSTWTKELLRVAAIKTRLIIRLLPWVSRSCSGVDNVVDAVVILTFLAFKRGLYGRDIKRLELPKGNVGDGTSPL